MIKISVSVETCLNDIHTDLQTEVDIPETGKFRPKKLHNYPPRIVCRFYPEDHTPPRTTCTLSFTGFDEEVKIVTESIY